MEKFSSVIKRALYTDYGVQTCPSCHRKMDDTLRISNLRCKHCQTLLHAMTQGRVEEQPTWLKYALGSISLVLISIFLGTLFLDNTHKSLKIGGFFCYFIVMVIPHITNRFYPHKYTLEIHPTGQPIDWKRLGLILLAIAIGIIALIFLTSWALQFSPADR